MKATKLVLFFALIAAAISCNGQGEKKSTTATSSSNIEVYYFHFTARCATCRAVEDNAKSAVEALYPEQIKSGEYSFKGINLDDASSKAIAEKLGIGGQTLLVVCGDKKVDLTSVGFMYAHDPAKIKEEIKKAVEKVLKG